MSIYTKILKSSLGEEVFGESQESMLMPVANLIGQGAGYKAKFVAAVEQIASEGIGPSDIDGVGIRVQREGVREVLAIAELYEALISKFTSSESAEMNLGYLIGEEQARAMKTEAFISQYLADEVTRATGWESAFGQDIQNQVSQAEGNEAGISDTIVGMGILNQKREQFFAQEIINERGRSEGFESTLMGMLDLYFDNDTQGQLDSVSELQMSINNASTEQRDQIYGKFIEYNDAFLATKDRLDQGFGSNRRISVRKQASDLGVNDGVYNFTISSLKSDNEYGIDSPELYALDLSIENGIKVYRNGMRDTLGFSPTHAIGHGMLAQGQFDSVVCVEDMSIMVGCPKLAGEAPLGSEDEFVIVLSLKEFDNGQAELLDAMNGIYDGGQLSGVFTFASDLSESGLVMDLATLTNPNWSFEPYLFHAGEVSVESSVQRVDWEGNPEPWWDYWYKMECLNQAEAEQKRDDLIALFDTSYALAAPGPEGSRMFVNSGVLFTQDRRDSEASQIMVFPQGADDGTWLANPSGCHDIYAVEDGGTWFLRFHGWDLHQSFNPNNPPAGPEYADGEVIGILDMWKERMSGHWDDLPEGNA